MAAQISTCCLEKQLSVCRGIWGSVCPPLNTFPQLKPTQAGGSWDGGCWGEERKGEMVRVGEMQQGGRVQEGWG